MKFEETDLYKYLDAKAYKVTLNDGRVIKSDSWIAAYEDGNKKQFTPEVTKKMEVKRGKA